MTHAAYTPVQNAFRFYADDAAPSTSTALAAQDTNINPTISGNYSTQLRFRLDETGGAAGSTNTWQLQYSHNGGAYTNVTTSSSVVLVHDSTHFTNNSDLGSLRIGGDTIGRGFDTTGSFTATLGATEEQEHLFALTVVAADVANNDTIDFRILEAGATITYNVTPRITVFDSSQTLTPSLYTNPNTFHAPTVAPGAVGLTPSLYTNSQTFHGPTATTSYSLTPGLYTNPNTFHAPTVSQNQGLTPSLYTNTNTFFAPTVVRDDSPSLAASQSGTGTFSSGSANINTSGLSILENDVVLIGVVIAGQADRDLSASGNNNGVYTELADLYANDTADCNLGVFLKKQGATVDTQITVGAGTGSEHFTYRILVYRGVNQTTQIDVTTTTATDINTDRANAPSITPSTVNSKIVTFLGGAQVSSTAWTASGNVNNFVQQAAANSNGTLPDRWGRIATGDSPWTSGAFDPDVVGGGNNNAQESWAAVTLALRPQPAEQTLTPTLFSNTNSFFAPSVATSYTITPSLYTNAQTFHAPAVTTIYTVTPALYTNTQTFHGPTVASTYAVTPGLFTNTNTFFGPTITQGGGTQGLTPTLYTNTQTFFSPSVVVDQDLAPTLFTNTNTFFSPTISGEGDIAPTLFTNSQTFFGPTLSATYELLPVLVSNVNSFFAPTAVNENTLSPALVENTSTFFSPTIAGAPANLQSPILMNYSKFFSPSIDAPNKRVLSHSSFAVGKNLPPKKHKVLHARTD